jgi:hypothetical protein
MESRIYSLVITSILAFALIAAAAAGGEIPTKAFENVLAQGEDSSLQDGNITGMPQDQISEGEVTGEFIVTQKGTIDKDVFYIPKNLVDHFDGSTVFFTVTEEEVKQYKRD